MNITAKKVPILKTISTVQATTSTHSACTTGTNTERSRTTDLSQGATVVMLERLLLLNRAVLPDVHQFLYLIMKEAKVRIATQLARQHVQTEILEDVLLDVGAHVEALLVAVLEVLVEVHVAAVIAVVEVPVEALVVADVVEEEINYEFCK